MITGKKVYLAAVERTSLEQLRAWRNSPRLRRYFREYREISSEMQEAWYRDRVLANDKQVDFEIHDLESGKLIGHTGLYYINWTDRNAEFGIYIGDTAFTGRGYGSDALRLLVEYGFHVLNLNRIWCEVYANNGAIDVYRRLGFVDEGTKRQHHFDEGQYWDNHMLGLLRSEWEGRTTCA